MAKRGILTNWKHASLTPALQKEINDEIVAPLSMRLMDWLAVLIWQYCEKVPYDIFDSQGVVACYPHRPPTSNFQDIIDELYRNHCEYTLKSGNLELNTRAYLLPDNTRFTGQDLTWDRLSILYTLDISFLGYMITAKNDGRCVTFVWRKDNRVVFTHTMALYVKKYIDYQSRLYLFNETSIEVWCVNDTGPYMYACIKLPLFISDFCLLSHDDIVLVENKTTSRLLKLLQR